jgi:unsaturated rhamnogalacturonyl hydrolase
VTRTMFSFISIANAPLALLAILLCWLSFSSTSVSAAEISWDVGLTAQRNLISAHGVIQDENAPTILYLTGLEGPSQYSTRLNSLLESYGQTFSADSTTDSEVNVIVIGNANPDSETLQFPPTGAAYSENSVSHVLWRWIGAHAPDLIVLEDGQDFGFREALADTGIAGFGNIPIERLSANNSDVQFLQSNSNLVRSEAGVELDRRTARSATAMAEQLATIYGYDFTTPAYVPGMSVIGRLRLGDVDGVNVLLSPYLRGESIEVSNSSVMAGQLVFAEHARLTGSEVSRNLVLQAANLAFDDNGEPLDVMPMHYEMSDSFFMATPLLVKAGVLSGEEKYFDMAIRHVSYMRNLLLRDNKLYRHSPDADVAWSRGNGFPAYGLALSLSEFPKTHPARDLMLGFLVDHLEALLPYQDADGMWHEVIDHPGSFAEITSTAMIGMAIKRGLDNGWLAEAIYRPVLDKAWNGIKIRTSFDGVFINACTSTGKMPSLDDYLGRLAIFDQDDRAGGMVMNFAIDMAGL